MANEIKQVALYIRVSTDQQAKHGDSLDEQQHTLNEYVRQQGNMRVFKYSRNTRQKQCYLVSRYTTFL